MKLLKKINRKVVSPLILGVHGDKLIRSLSSRSVLNIMYHGVTKVNSNFFSPRHISSDQFEKHLQYYSREFDVISLSEAFTYLKENYKPKRKTLTISFDDGYRNNLTTAIPLLEKYNLKATFFISGICSEEMKIRSLWTDIISYIKYRHSNEIIELGNEKFIDFLSVSSGKSLGDYLSMCDLQQLRDNMEYLISRYNIESEIKNIPEEFWKLLDSNEIQRVAASGIAEIGSHCYSHSKMEAIGMEGVRNELKLSKDALQNLTGREVKMVAYPFGSYNPLVKDAAEECGYDQQIAVDYLNPEDRGDPRILNRYGIPATTTYEANILLLNNAFRIKGFN